MYNYRDEIINCFDAEERPAFMADILPDLLYEAGQRIIAENGSDYYDCSYDEAVTEEASNIIHLWAIKRESTLYRLLKKWYAPDDPTDHVRDSFIRGRYLYFVTGCGYSIFEQDLLNINKPGYPAKNLVFTIEAWDDFVAKELANV